MRTYGVSGSLGSSGSKPGAMAMLGYSEKTDFITECVEIRIQVFSYVFALHLILDLGLLNFSMWRYIRRGYDLSQCHTRTCYHQYS